VVGAAFLYMPVNMLDGMSTWCMCDYICLTSNVEPLCRNAHTTCMKLYMREYVCTSTYDKTIDYLWYERTVQCESERDGCREADG